MQCAATEQPPADLIARARAKMEAVKASGDILDYQIFENRLQRVWTAFRNASSVPEGFKLTMSLATGILDLHGLKVEKTSVDKALVKISISVPGSTVQTWKYEWFKTFVVRKARELGIKEHLNNAQIYSAYIRGSSGDPVQDFSIGNTAMGDSQGDKPFSVVASKQRREICLVIRRAKDLLAKATRDSLLQLVSQAVSKMSDNSAKYVVQKKDLIAALQSILEGPEVLGEDLPTVLLAAHASLVTQSNSSNVSAPGHIHFNVSEDKMEAAIAGFDLSYYKEKDFEVNLEWLQSELKRCSIKSTIDEEVAAKLSEMIMSREDLNGMVVCYGVPAVAGREPYIYHSFKDTASKSTPENEDLDVDLRDLQQRTMVKEGQLVAELRYKKPAESGVTVYGDVVEPAINDDFVIHVGEGVQQKSRRFYATCDGVPVIENESISLNKSLIFNGDVDLRSGNIRFDGPVEIKGAIDNGSVVETTGDLIVHGTIRGAHVKAGGNITVYSGIVTGNIGSIYAGGDIRAEFVENSSVTCRGNLIVGRALLNCRVVSNGSIEIRANDGVLAGGKIICREKIKAGNLGFKRGASTDLLVGIDWRIARRIEIRRERLLKLEKASQDYRQSLRELVQKSKSQLTAKHKKMKEDMQQKLVKSKLIIERVEKFLQVATAELTYNSESKIIVVDQLSSNVKIQLCGQTIAVANEVASVAIVPKRRRGSFIVPLEEIEAEEKVQKAG
jgi:uncharacterized protein (DUF342 family)